MTITKTLNGSELEMSIGGRLDTTTAPELEGALNESLEGIEKLIFDFASLEYISSAGLRVILATQKKMSKQGEFVLKNVSDDVQEVFDITGFSDILTII